MKRVGQILKEERLRRKLTLDDIEKYTKIRRKVLEALEEGDYSKLPAETFVKGFIKNYGEFLNLPTSSLLAVFRREFTKQANIEKRQPPRLKLSLSLTPNLTIASIFSVGIVVLLIYLIFQYVSLAAAPQLVIDSPQNNQKVTQNEVEVVGKTDPDANLEINDERVPLDQEGNFKILIKLSSGENKINISS